MVRVAVCDDCPAQMQDVLAMLAAYQAERPCVKLDAAGFTEGGAVLEALKNGRSFDLFLLDVIMPGLSGIELAREIRAQSGQASLIFLTNSEDHALEAFQVQATQYLLKPADSAAFYHALDRAVSELRRGREEFLLVSTQTGKVRVSFSAIVFVESLQRELHIHLAGGQTVRSKTIRVPFAEAVDPLLRDTRFLYAHKSYVLNMSMVERLTRQSFVMTNGMEIHVPRYKYAAAKARYLDYLSAQGIGLLGGLL